MPETRDRNMPAAIAIAAHPDDIEFGMAGTLLLLKDTGWEIHYLNVSTGNCGSMVTGPAATARVRRQEAQAAARILGAKWFPPFCDDLEIIYSVERVRRLAAVIRDVNPRIILTHAPVDYMEDHTETCRLVVTAAFAKNMPNFHTKPRQSPAAGDVTLYHAMPHGLVTPLREPVTPDLLLDTASVHRRKRAALAAHASQKEWLDATQGMDSYLAAMDELSQRTAAMGRGLKRAEGWRRHLHLGFSAADGDPLASALAKFCSKPRKNLR